jgi:hypothetical protein
LGKALADVRQTGGEAIFENGDVVLLLTTLVRPRGELAIAHRPKLATKSVARDRYRELVPYPPGKIGEPLAHHAMRRRDRPRLNDISQAGTLLVVQDRCAPRRFARRQPMRAPCVEAQDPVADDLTICSITPATFAASLRLPPSRINAIASSRRT